MFSLLFPEFNLNSLLKPQLLLLPLKPHLSYFICMCLFHSIVFILKIRAARLIFL